MAKADISSNSSDRGKAYSRSDLTPFVKVIEAKHINPHAQPPTITSSILPNKPHAPVAKSKSKGPIRNSGDSKASSRSDRRLWKRHVQQSSPSLHLPLRRHSFKHHTPGEDDGSDKSSNLSPRRPKHQVCSRSNITPQWQRPSSKRQVHAQHNSHTQLAVITSSSNPSTQPLTPRQSKHVFVQMSLPC